MSETPLYANISRMGTRLRGLAPIPASAPLLVLLVLLAGCDSSPYTNRSRFIIISQAQEFALGAQASRQILERERISRDPERVAQVRRIGERIARVADRPDFGWEFHVIDKPGVPNAFCLPGGRIFVYTGLFRFARTDDELAAVIGHEVAHALLRHGAERMSMEMAARAGGELAGALLGLEGLSGQVFDAAYGVGASLGMILPYSRKHEYEADQVGLLLMAKAGYDPRAALTFWRRMAESGKDKGVLEFLSTHPTDEKRIQALRGLMSQAEANYQPAP